MALLQVMCVFHVTAAIMCGYNNADTDGDGTARDAVLKFIAGFLFVFSLPVTVPLKFFYRIIRNK